MKTLLKILFCSFLLIGFFSIFAFGKTEPGPPVTPAWVFDHWVWDGGPTTQDDLLKLVKDYKEHDIPVGAVIIDAPWMTEYDNLTFNPKQFPNPKEMIRILHEQNVKVVVWMTSMINKSNLDYKYEPTSSGLYEEALSSGYLCDGGRTISWWKGEGAFLDFTNPAAVEWWHGKIDRALKIGVDGLKAESAGAALAFPDGMKCSKGPLTKAKYLELFYKDLFEYVAAAFPKAAVLSRAADMETIPMKGYSALSNSQVVWVGDETHDRSGAGFMEALSDLFDSAKLGYAVIGADTAGYFGDMPINKKFLIRSAQLSALTPLFANGGFGAHQPWLHDEETLKIYRKFVKLHAELKPYLYSSMMESHNKIVPHNVMFEGNERIIPIIRPDEGRDWQYRLGDNLLVSTMYGPDDRRSTVFPNGRWYDFWSTAKEPYKEHDKIQYTCPLDKYPLFIRYGTIMPLNVTDSELGHGDESFSGFLTLDVYPGEDSRLDLYEEGRDVVFVDMKMMNDKDFRIHIPGGDRNFLLRILSFDKPDRIVVNGVTLTEGSSFSGIGARRREWSLDPETNRIYINPGPGAALVVEVFYSQDPAVFRREKKED